ncbi:MAG: hypothetical protein RJA19_667 [Bacteroidota bacterium]|jgi:23S rRNA pseudouridine2605 synthase
MADPNGPMRLNRYISNAGICSRREADVLIESGAVTVNDEVVVVLGARVLPTDVVKVGGDTIKPGKKRYVLINKPKGVIAAMEDAGGKRTLQDLLKGKFKEVLTPVGKMDREATGLMLLTNDDEMAQRLLHPRNIIRKLYHVTLVEKVNPRHVEEIAEGVMIEEGMVRAHNISYVGEERRQIGLEVNSNRSRIVERLFEHFGYHIAKIDRVTLGHLTKKDLPRGYFRELTEAEVNLFRMTTT